MFKITLNSHKPYNYAFFCPVSKLHLTVSNPVGFVHEVTPAISRGLKNGTLAMSEVYDSNGQVEEAEQKLNTEFQEAPTSSPENIQTSVGAGSSSGASPSSQASSASTENTGKKKKGRKAAVAAPADDVPNDLFKDI